MTALIVAGKMTFYILTLLLAKTFRKKSIFVVV